MLFSKIIGQFSLIFILAAVFVFANCSDERARDDRGAGDSDTDTDTDADSDSDTTPPTECGNGIKETGEECDDGNANSNTEPDACRTDCTNPSCGDGIIDVAAGEICDGSLDASQTCESEGFFAGTTSCASDCKSVDTSECHNCGDGQTQTGEGEECDEGTSNSDTTPNACRTDCTEPVCGDGVVDSDYEEICDGELDETQTCESEGFFMGTPSCATDCKSIDTSGCHNCGDGTTQTSEGEECDDGTSNSDNIPNACRKDCKNPVCGDGIIDTEFEETCDDANNVNFDNCVEGCKLASCGDGFFWKQQDGTEECDDGNTIDDDRCSNTCIWLGCEENIHTGNISLGFSGSTDILNYEGVTAIMGNLSIEHSDVTDLTPFECLEAISGNFKVYFSDNGMKNFIGMEHLKQIGGKLTLDYYYGDNMDGLNGLMSIGDDFTIDNADIIDLTGLEKLQNIGGQFSIEWSDNIKNVDALANLAAIGGRLFFEWSDALEDIEALYGLQMLGGNIVADWCDSLPVCQLENLRDILTSRGWTGSTNFGNYLDNSTPCDPVDLDGGTDTDSDTGIDTDLDAGTDTDTSDAG